MIRTAVMAWLLTSFPASVVIGRTMRNLSFPLQPAMVAPRRSR